MLAYETSLAYQSMTFIRTSVTVTQTRTQVSAGKDWGTGNSVAVLAGILKGSSVTGGNNTVRIQSAEAREGQVSPHPQLWQRCLQQLKVGTSRVQCTYGRLKNAAHIIGYYKLHLLPTINNCMHGRKFGHTWKHQVKQVSHWKANTVWFHFYEMSRDIEFTEKTVYEGGCQELCGREKVDLLCNGFGDSHVVCSTGSVFTGTDCAL